MSFTYGFYNSKNGDRKYNARQMALIFDALITNGVMMHVGDCFNVKPKSGMSVTVGVGFAWFNHTWSYNDSEMIMTTKDPDVLLDRIDALILEVDESESVRKNSIKWLFGTPATNPVKPTLTNNDHVHQYPLKYIRIPANAVMISSGNIENMVGTSACPFATGILEGMDIDSLIAQWDAQFDEWFEGMRGKLSGDVAGKLQIAIDELAYATADQRIAIDRLNTTLTSQQRTINELSETATDQQRTINDQKSEIQEINKTLTNQQDKTDRALVYYDINGINIDSTPGNWTVDISEEGHGTIPKTWVNVTQTTSNHFFVQTAIRCNSRDTNAYENGEVWHRDKYTGKTWSKWSKVAREQDVMPIADVKYIKYVTTLPNSPSTDTLYLIKK